MKTTTAGRPPSPARLKKIKLTIFDFDGIFTDNFIYLGADNSELKKFYVPDGVGIWLLHEVKIPVAIVTGNNTKTTAVRAKRLRIKYVYQNVRDKTKPYQELKKKLGVRDDECLYMGDDLTDLKTMQRVGIAVAPADAHPEVKKAAHWVTKQPGGHGAIREVAEALLAARGQLLSVFDE
jgi:3-deoxy-D-manno-octulosonate 8-phosphate phosphatase (KDO 8-P phosphatase)